jgi:hypothetical protein
MFLMEVQLTLLDLLFLLSKQQIIQIHHRSKTIQIHLRSNYNQIHHRTNNIQIILLKITVSLKHK